MVLDEQALVVDLLQGPPQAVDVRRIHRPVRLVGVDPVAHAFGHLLELVDVAQHRLTALGVELGDAVRLDVLLAGEPQLLLDGDLDGEPVAVPAGLAGNPVPLHRPVPGEDVLEDARLDVVGARGAVGGGGSLVEDPSGASARCSRLRWKVFWSCHRASTSCSSAGRSTCGGTSRYIGPPSGGASDQRDEAVLHGPAVPPSLAVVRADVHPLEVAAAGSTWPCRYRQCRSSGSSG